VKRVLEKAFAGGEVEADALVHQGDLALKAGGPEGVAGRLALDQRQGKLLLGTRQIALEGIGLRQALEEQRHE